MAAICHWCHFHQQSGECIFDILKSWLHIQAILCMHIGHIKQCICSKLHIGHIVWHIEHIYWHIYWHILHIGFGDILLQFIPCCFAYCAYYSTYFSTYSAYWIDDILCTFCKFINIFWHFLHIVNTVIFCIFCILLTYYFAY